MAHLRDVRALTLEGAKAMAEAASQDIAVLKARTAARLHRPTKALEDGIAGGRMALLSVPNILSLEGGVPVRVKDKVIGTIGVSGMTSTQDAEVAAAGVAAFRGNA